MKRLKDFKAPYEYSEYIQRQLEKITRYKGLTYHEAFIIAGELADASSILIANIREEVQLDLKADLNQNLNP